MALVSAGAANAALVEKAVSYEKDGVTMEGFHVYDDAVSGKRPAVLVIHQWMGLTDNEKRRSRMLAELGYNVLAADVYGKGVRPHRPVRRARRPGNTRRTASCSGIVLAGLEVLKGDERTDDTKIAAIGYCFGGMGALELAGAGAPVAGVVSFHGGLDAADGMEAKRGSGQGAGSARSGGSACSGGAGGGFWEGNDSGEGGLADGAFRRSRACVHSEGSGR